MPNRPATGIRSRATDRRSARFRTHSPSWSVAGRTRQARCRYQPEPSAASGPPSWLRGRAGSRNRVGVGVLLTIPRLPLRPVALASRGAIPAEAGPVALTTCLDRRSFPPDAMRRRQLWRAGHMNGIGVCSPPADVSASGPSQMWGAGPVAMTTCASPGVASSPVGLDADKRRTSFPQSTFAASGPSSQGHGVPAGGRSLRKDELDDGSSFRQADRDAERLAVPRDIRQDDDQRDEGDRAKAGHRA